MDLEETTTETALRARLRAYFAELLTPAVRGALADEGEGGKVWRETVAKMGSDGWLGFGWPEEFGGGGHTASEQFIMFDETRRAGAPFPFVTINTVGPTLMRYGTDEQKARFLPGILAGEIIFAIGYTEPAAGTDLASLSTRAIADGDEYVVNGAKIFTSGAEMADWVWLAVRTDTEAPKHKGISVLCVATDSPGFTWSLIETVGGLSTTATYYEDVRVPAHLRVGAENEGWRMITNQLNHERVGLAAWSGVVGLLYEETLADADLTVPWVRLDLARARAEIETMRLLNWKMVAETERGTLEPGASSAVKVFGTETMIEMCRLLQGVVGAAAYVRGPRLEASGRQAQINTFGGGVNEVQREIVATAGLGMKRGDR